MPIDGFVSRLAAIAGSRWRILIALTNLAVALLFAVYIIRAHKLFWDFDVYRAGIAAFQATGTAYNFDYLRDRFAVNLPFTYPPLVLLAFAHVSWLFMTRTGEAVLLLMHLAAFCAIPYLLIPRELRRVDLAWMSAVFLTAFGLSGAKLLLAGNIAAIVSALVLAALHYAVPRRGYAALWVVLLLVCQIKIYFICFGMVPFLLERKVMEPLAATMLIIGASTLNYFAPPVLLHGFSASLASVSRDAGLVGSSVLSLAQLALKQFSDQQWLLSEALAWSAHCAYALLILGFGALVMWSSKRPQKPYAGFLWAYMAALLVSPRLAPYDIALLVIPFLVLLRSLLTERGFGLIVAVAGFVVAASLATTSLADWGGLSALLGVWVGAGIDWLNADPRYRHG